MLAVVGGLVGGAEAVGVLAPEGEGWARLGKLLAGVRDQGLAVARVGKGARGRDSNSMFESAGTLRAAALPIGGTPKNKSTDGDAELHLLLSDRDAVVAGLEAERVHHVRQQGGQLLDVQVLLHQGAHVCGRGGQVRGRVGQHAALHGAQADVLRGPEACGVAGEQAGRGATQHPMHCTVSTCTRIHAARLLGKSVQAMNPAMEPCPHMGKSSTCERYVAERSCRQAVRQVQEHVCRV